MKPRNLKFKQKNTQEHKPVNRKRGVCCLCHREVYLTFHHLIPKKIHRRRAFKKKYKRAELAVGIDICRQCHNGIHSIYDEMTLAKHFNTLASLQTDPRLSKHFAWVAKQHVVFSENEGLSDL